jgi:hypothetical protein
LLRIRYRLFLLFLPSPFLRPPRLELGKDSVGARRSNTGASLLTDVLDDEVVDDEGEALGALTETDVGEVLSETLWEKQGQLRPQRRREMLRGDGECAEERRREKAMEERTNGRLKEVKRGISNAYDLIAGLEDATESRLNKEVVGGDAVNRVDALGLELVVLLDVGRDVVLGAGLGEAI